MRIILIILLVKESTVVRETVQLLMEHGHMRLMELLLTVMTIPVLEKFVVKFVVRDSGPGSYIQLMNVVEANLIRTEFTQIVLKGAVLVLECIMVNDLQALLPNSQIECIVSIFL